MSVHAAYMCRVHANNCPSAKARAPRERVTREASIAQERRFVSFAVSGRAATKPESNSARASIAQNARFVAASTAQSRAQPRTVVADPCATETGERVRQAHAPPNARRERSRTGAPR